MRESRIMRRGEDGWEGVEPRTFLCGVPARRDPPQLVEGEDGGAAAGAVEAGSAHGSAR